MLISSGSFRISNSGVPGSGFRAIDVPTPTYSFSSAPSSINEGSSGSFTISTTNVINGTTLYWTILNGTSADSDFSAVSGSFTITNGTGTFNITTAADLTTEGPQTFTVQVRLDSIAGTIVATSDTITINDTSGTPTYSFISVPISINEGNVGTFNVNTTNVANNTTLYWTISNGTTSSGDFLETSNSFIINNNSGTFTVSLLADLALEGSETFAVQLRTGNVSGIIVATSNTITVNDTSVPTYSFSSIPSSINEGSSGTFNVSTAGVANGTTLYWTISHGTSSTGDFSATSGSFTINANAGSFNVTTVADATTEGSETFSVQIRTGSTGGTIVATSDSVTINDTSLTPTYNFGLIPSSMDEGNTSTFNVVTTNVSDATTLYWTISHGTSAAGDFANTSGSFNITSNAGSFAITTLADATTEGPQTFAVQLRTGNVSGIIVATSANVTINDTSGTPTYNFGLIPSSMDEGNTSTFNVVTTNVGNGTTLYWTIAHVTSSSADFANTSGSFAISANAGSFNITTVADTTTEGSETFAVQLRTGNVSGIVVATSSNVTISDTSIAITGAQVFIIPGTYTWIPPEGVTSVSVVAVGGGGGGASGLRASGGFPNTEGMAGGGGGGLGYKNNISVIPGQSYTVVVGAGGAGYGVHWDPAQLPNAGTNGTDGGDSYFINTSTVMGGGGKAANLGKGGAGGTYVGDGGGNGGRGANTASDFIAVGAGGAGGYSGNGGNGSSTGTGTVGSGGGGGGSAGGSPTAAGGGGGVGLLGQGTSGAAIPGGSGNRNGGGGGSGGANGFVGARVLGGICVAGNGGAYGGGGGGVSNQDNDWGSGFGGDGAVRIIWPGTTRQFPTTNVGD